MERIIIDVITGKRESRLCLKKKEGKFGTKMSVRLFKHTQNTNENIEIFIQAWSKLQKPQVDLEIERWFFF